MSNYSALALLLCPMTVVAIAGDDATDITAALSRAGENRPQIEEALRRSADDQREGMQFLVAHMPQRDL